MLDIDIERIIDDQMINDPLIEDECGNYFPTDEEIDHWVAHGREFEH